MDSSNKEVFSYAQFLSNLSGNEFAIIASLSGYFLSQNLTPEQQNSLGNFFEAVGQIMLCIASQNQNLQAMNKQQKK